MWVGSEFEKGCLIPMLQSAVTGLLVGGAVLAVVFWLGRRGDWPLALAGGSLAALSWWVGSVRAWRRAIWTDINLPGVESADTPSSTTPEPRPVRIELVTNSGATKQFIDLPASQEQLAELAAGVLSGSSFSEASWTPGLFSRSQFSKLRDELIRRRLVTWNSPNTPARGVALTSQGKAVFRYFASLSPTLRGDDSLKRG